MVSKKAQHEYNKLQAKHAKGTATSKDILRALQLVRQMEREGLVK